MAAGSIDGWEDAGVLDMGAGNTADPSTSGPPLAGGWFWKFEVDSYEYVTLRLDATFVDAAAVTVSFQVGTSFKDYDYPTDPLTFGGAEETFQAKPWLKYWVIATVSPEEDAAQCTGLTLTRGLLATPQARTGWSTQLKDRDDNVLVLSAASTTSTDYTGPFTGQLMDLNRDKYNPRVPSTELIDYTWYLRAIETFGNEIDHTRTGPPRRRGFYFLQEVIGGDDPITADDCVWNHVKVGDVGTGYWNQLGYTFTGPATPPTCLPTPPDLSPATADDGWSTPAYSLSYVPGAILASSSLTGVELKVTRGVWLRPVRDNLSPAGVLEDSDIDLAAAGLPADYAGTYYIEYEDDFTELVRVDVAADRVDQSESDPLDTKIQLDLDLNYLPSYSGGEWSDSWKIGTLGDEVVPPPPTRKMRLTYNSGTPTWNHLSAIDAWDDCAHWPDEDPDAIVAMELDIEGTPPVDSSAVGYVDLALRFTLHASRFRIVYFPELLPVPVRKTPRSDGYGYESATRSLASIPAERHIGGDWD